MKASRQAIAGMLSLSIVGLAMACVPAPDSTPPPEDEVTVTAAPAPDPSRSASATVFAEPTNPNWIDKPRSAGDWHFVDADEGSRAGFGVMADGPDFLIGCMRDGRIVLIRAADGLADSAAMTVRTETLDRTFSTRLARDGKAVSIALGARDPILDAMALSRGRFAVETQGAPTLYLPAWAEVTRVIEDCR